MEPFAESREAMQNEQKDIEQRFAMIKAEAMKDMRELFREFYERIKNHLEKGEEKEADSKDCVEAPKEEEDNLSESASKNAEKEKARLLQSQDEGTSATIKSIITTNNDKDRDRKSGLGESEEMANLGEIFGNDDSDVREGEAPPCGPRSEEERTCRFEDESTCDQYEAEDIVQGSETGGHAEADASASDDERRNESEAEHSDHSVKGEGSRSDVAPERSHHSDEEEDEAEAASVRSEGLASDFEAREREEEYSETERSKQSRGDASGNDVEQESSDRPDLSDAEVVGSEHQDNSDAERETSVDGDVSDSHQQNDSEQEGSIDHVVSDAEQSEHQEESEIVQSGSEDEEGGKCRCDRHSDRSARSRSPKCSESEVSESEAKSGLATDNESVHCKKTKQAGKTEGSQRGSDSDEKVVHRKRRKQRARSGKVENLPMVTKPDIEQRWNSKATKKRLLCVPGSVSWVVFVVTAVFLGALDGTGDSVSPFPWRVTLSGAVGTSTGVPQRQDICGTSACVEAASHLKNCVRPGTKNLVGPWVDPSGNVGGFSCSDWLRSRSRPPGEGCLLARKSVSERLGRSVHAVVGSPPSRKCKILYQSCMNLTALGSTGSKPLGTFLGELGGWSFVEGEAWKKDEFDWVETLDGIAKAATPSKGLKNECQK